LATIARWGSIGNADTARGLEILLKLYGHDVVATNDGKAVVKAAQTYRPDVVLLDIGLPGVDGYQVAATLREDVNLKKVLIIAVSGYGQEEDHHRSRDAGFDHHTVKPVDHKALVRLLTSA
jgi:CheY-like chemotaxis protein